MNISGVIIISVLCLSFSVIGSGQGSRRRLRNRLPFRRLNNRYGGLPSALVGVYEEAASDLSPTTSIPTGVTPAMSVSAHGEEQDSMSVDAAWRNYIPSTPMASEVECYVEDTVVVRQGGRCIRLAGMHRVAVCQSGVHIAFVPDCEGLLSAREAQQDQASTTLQP